MVFPTRGIFAGQGAIINLAGEKGAMVVASPAAQYLTLTTGGFLNFPGSLMGVMAYMRQIYLDAAHYRAERDRYNAQPAGVKRPDYDRALEGVLESPRILLPASRAVELDRMTRLARDLKQPAVLYGGAEAYASARMLREGRHAAAGEHEMARAAARGRPGRSRCRARTRDARARSVHPRRARQSRRAVRALH